MPDLLLLRGAKQLLTLRGPSGLRRGKALHELGVIEDASVLIRDGLIACIGPTRRVENLKEARGALQLSVEGAVVMPGFVDPGLRLNLMPTANGARRAHKPKKISDFCSESLMLMRSCLAHGTLNLQVKANAGIGGFRSDVSVLKQLAEFGEHPVRMVRAWRIDSFGDVDDSPDDYHANLQFLRQRNLAHSVEVGLDSNTCLGDRVWTAAGEKRFGVNLLWSGGSADALSDLLRRAAPRTVYSPSNLTKEECATLAEAPILTVFSPNKELLEEQGGDAARRIADAGGAIALSSGYEPAHTPSFSMQMAIALAVLRLRLTPEEAIAVGHHQCRARHRNRAFYRQLGSGKRADLLVLNVPDYREIPRRLAVNSVNLALRDGKIVFSRSASKVRTNYAAG